MMGYNRTLAQNPQFIQHAHSQQRNIVGWGRMDQATFSSFSRKRVRNVLKCLIWFRLVYKLKTMHTWACLCCVCLRVQCAQHSVVHIIEISIWGINRVSISPPPYRRHLCEFVHLLTVHGDFVRPSLFINDGCVLYYAITRKCISKHESHSH